jgi:hypothetical protein
MFAYHWRASIMSSDPAQVIAEAAAEVLAALL